MSKHTPGPWRADLETYPIMVRSESETWPLVDDLGNEEGRAGVFVANTGDHKANARLIAAAPDLLAALERMEFAFSPLARDCTLANLIDDSRAAIAKATGEAA